MDINNLGLKIPLHRIWCLKKRSLFRLSLVTLAITLVWYRVVSNINERNRMINQRALEFAYRDLEAATEGVQDYKPDWKEVVGGEGRVFVYSAFLDHRVAVSPQVRVLVLAPLQGNVIVECTFWTVSNQSITVVGQLTIFPEHHDISLATGTVDCPLPQFIFQQTPTHKSPSNLFEPNFNPYTKGNTSSERSHQQDTEDIYSQYTSLEDRTNWVHETTHDTKTDPVVRVAIGVTEGTSRDYSNSIPVEVLVNRRKRGELNVCVKQMHSRYNSASWLVEFIELQRLLGADHFTFYNLSMGPDVDLVLQHYVQQGLADVMPFTAPGSSNIDNMRRVILASLNDCILRSVGRYPLVAITDVDEIIVPRRVDDNLKMVQQLGHYAEYGVQNAWFYLFYDDDDNRNKDAQLKNEAAGDNAQRLSPDGAKDLILVTQRKTRRAAEINPHKIRSKYLCRPELVLVAGIHSVHTFFGRGSVAWVDSATALSHHYRGSCEEDDPGVCYDKPSVVDRTAHRFRKHLTNSVIRSCQRIFPDREICLPPSQHDGS